MKAAVVTAYGPPSVVRITSTKRPAPRANEVLIRIHATTISAADVRLRTADPWIVRLVAGLRRPHRMPVLGMEFAGTVESVGSTVTRFAPGDRVFGASGFRAGAHAEYISLREDSDLAPKPANMSFDEAAAVMFGGHSALHFLQRAKVRAGQKVLVYGASGSVGVFAVQLAKRLGAHVTAVCSTRNLELVKSLGADEAIDYTREDFAAAGPVYDVVFDAVGRTAYPDVKRCLRQGGTYVQLGGPGGMSAMVTLIAQGLWARITGRARFVSGVARATHENTALLRELIESGKLRTVIDKRYDLDAIAEAHAYAETGRKRGHVVVLVTGSDQQQ